MKSKRQLYSRLGINIDHIATLRQARGTCYPDPFQSLKILRKCCVAQATIHLREDRRHIQDEDLQRIIQAKILPVNLEMALTQEMVRMALKHKPHTCTLVPEKRKEITTEGGLDLFPIRSKLQKYIPLLVKKGIRVSLFIDPSLEQVAQAARLGVDGIELHTGAYCEVFGTKKEKSELRRLDEATFFAKTLGLKVFAGHGLNRENLKLVTHIHDIEEYNIGHSIIARAVFVGLEKAIREIQEV